MKRLVLVAIMAAVALTSISCIREEDMEIFKHPIHIQGSIDPNFGVPIGQGEMNLNDLLTTLDDTYTGLILPEEDILTIYYENSIRDTLHLNHFFDDDKHSGKKGHHGTKDVGDEGDSIIWADTVLHYNVDIDLFNKVSADELSDYDMSIGHLWVSLVSYLGSDSPDANRQDILDNASIVFKDYALSYVDHIGDTHQFHDLNLPPISLFDFLTGGEIHFEDVDMAEIINSLPQAIIASYRMTLKVDTSYFTGITVPDIRCFKDLADSLHLTWMSFAADLSVRFPMMIHIGALPFHYTIDFGDALEQVDLESILQKIDENVQVTLEESSLNLIIENGLPLDLAIRGTLIDENGVPLSCIIPLDTIKAAPVAPLADGSGDHEAIGTTTSKIRALLDYDKLVDLNNSKGLRFDFGVATGDGHAAIKRTDKLKVRVYLQVHPNISVDIPIGGGGNNNNNDDEE